MSTTHGSPRLDRFQKAFIMNRLQEQLIKVADKVHDYKPGCSDLLIAQACQPPCHASQVYNLRNAAFGRTSKIKPKAPPPLDFGDHVHEIQRLQGRVLEARGEVANRDAEIAFLKQQLATIAEMARAAADAARGDPSPVAFSPLSAPSGWERGGVGGYRPRPVLRPTMPQVMERDLQSTLFAEGEAANVGDVGDVGDVGE